MRSTNVIKDLVYVWERVDLQMIAGGQEGESSLLLYDWIAGWERKAEKY